MKDKIMDELRGMLRELIMTGDIGEMRADSILLGRGGIADSLTAALFIAQTEERFGVDIVQGDPDLACCETLNALADYILHSERKML